MSIKRRDFLLGAASVALGGPEMPPLPLPYGPTGFDPRQPLKERILPPAYKTRPYTMQPSASPVHLSASLVLRANTNGAPAPAALKNPMGLDMEILEIKFELSGAYNPSVGGAAPIFGGTINCDLAMGSIRVTHGPIPVWSFGRAENFEGEVKLDVTDLRAFVAYSWRLPRPLFVPAGAVLIPNFNHTGFVPDTINVRVGYSARTIFTQPKKIYVPWVSAYASKVFNPASAAGVDTSSELDLVNINPEVFHLQRFTGRTLFLAANGTYAEDAPQGFGSQNLLVRITDSYGRPVVRSFTPFRSVFSAVTRSWELENSGAELDPEAYYKVNLQKAAVTGVTATGASGQAFIGMVGWREVDGSTGLSAALAPPAEENP